MRTIRVTGKGQIRVRPDVIKLTLTLEGTETEYSKTLQRSAEETERLKDILGEFGFERTDLKTVGFHVDTVYENYKENNIFKKRFAGYRFRHMVKLEFDLDHERLGRILYVLANSPIKAEFRIGYTVRDKEAAKNELLGKAVADAEAKAAVLAKAAGVTLKDIQSVDYSWGEIDLEMRQVGRASLDEERVRGVVPDSGYDLGIEPDDIEVTDTVTVVWEIQ